MSLRYQLALFLFLFLTHSTCRAAGYATSGLYFFVGGDYVVDADSFDTTISTTRNGATIDDFPIVNRTALELVYDTNTGGRVYGGIGYIIGNYFMFEMEYQHANFSYVSDTSVVALDSTGSSQYIADTVMSVSMDAFIVNGCVYYDNGLNTMFFAGIGIGMSSPKNTLRVDVSNSEVVRSNTIFSAKSSHAVAQALVGMNFLMTNDMSVFIRVSASMISSFGLEHITPHHKVDPTVTTPPFIPGAPLFYDAFGLFYKFYGIGVGIRIFV